MQNQPYLRNPWSKVVKRSRPTERPREFLGQLEPNLAELYSQLQPVIASRISARMSRPLAQGIDPNRVLIFAFLYATAEQLAEEDALTKEHVRRSKLELAGEIHGMQTGYEDDAEAKERYRRGRRARQQVKASRDAVVEKWRVLRLASPLGPLRQFNLAHPKSLIYLARRFSASPGFSSLYIGTMVEAVRMWESRSDFQGRWEGWKTDLGFPGFPPSVISTAGLVRFGSLLLFRRSTETIRFCAGLQDVRAVGDAIQQGFAEPRVRNHLRPLGEWQVGR
jgi:hypothetical protein